MTKFKEWFGGMTVTEMGVIVVLLLVLLFGLVTLFGGGQVVEWLEWAATRNEVETTE